MMTSRWASQAEEMQPNMPFQIDALFKCLPVDKPGKTTGID